LIANVDGQLYDSPEQITEKLLRQLTSAVRWQQSIEFLLDQNAQRFVEIGPGRVLTGLLKKICRARKQQVQQLNISGLNVT
jgi:[acyl-carrier-protein] S-malonyltransferase